MYCFVIVILLPFCSLIGNSRALTMPTNRRSMPGLVGVIGGMNQRTYSQYSDLNSESGTLPSHGRRGKTEILVLCHHMVGGGKLRVWYSAFTW